LPQPNVETLGANEVTANPINLTNQVQFTALLRPSDAPLKPTTWPPSRYNNCTRLMELRLIHRHDTINSNMKGHEWEDSKNDPNRWSQIKKVYDRIKSRVVEIGEDINNKDEWVRAAKWLDLNEKKEMTMNKYVLFLREKYSKKRK
jgi:hypothetical protein